MIISRFGEIYDLPNSNSHEDIINDHKIKLHDKKDVQLYARVEVTPEFKLDENAVPAWWTDELTQKCIDWYERWKDVSRHYVSKYDNGNIRVECEYVNGGIHGHYVEKYDNGNIRVECEYVNGGRQ